MCADHVYDSDNIYFNDPVNQNDNEICDLTENKDADQLLIDLVRLYPHLWDKQKRDFKDSAKKETSWEEISSILNQSVSVCQARWQRLRQYYAKERQKQELESRSGSKAVNRMPWYLFSMNFLDSHMYKRRCVGF
ncbi:PREDICTED: transcription factor Adf-1-like [Cyphomyrmex costatus]|uniref:transcription factor Adf-1-like n=1 Tax=Cyphomyrmex costatus TaxID=456900 RepID=UPI000852342D|nr:PREDICTED: transcription factor Adf-1-like [Cyphomyrmex costatus]